MKSRLIYEQRVELWRVSDRSAFPLENGGDASEFDGVLRRRLEKESCDVTESVRFLTLQRLSCHITKGCSSNFV